MHCHIDKTKSSSEFESLISLFRILAREKESLQSGTDETKEFHRLLNSGKNITVQSCTALKGHFKAKVHP